ncbi:MAG: type VI secretion system baseplate subunit TssK, partial [Candidatus Competibacter sp.]|nr:type VI secretion system baseplate subunit TssK [Candidatus Competibacter sp.]
MSWYSKVVWSEGMFLRPQHFQQQDRYLEALVRQSCRHLRPYDWGV